MLKRIFTFLADPRLNGVDYNSDDRINIHRKIVSEKDMLREVFKEFYDKFHYFDKKYFSGTGSYVEIGAGVSIMKDYYPHTLVTDIKCADFHDKVIDAQDMDFDDHSIRAILGINCFHHFPQPSKFFDELKRVLVPGGGCVLVDPYYGWLASMFYKKLFATETFIKDQQQWETSGPGVMQDANQALSYIVFERDRKLFEKLHSELEIVETRPTRNYLRYLFSGGLNFRPLVPGYFSKILKVVEFSLTPIERFLALHHFIVLKKVVV